MEFCICLRDISKKHDVTVLLGREILRFFGPYLEYWDAPNDGILCNDMSFDRSFDYLSNKSCLVDIVQLGIFLCPKKAKGTLSPQIIFIFDVKKCDYFLIWKPIPKVKTSSDRTCQRPHFDTLPSKNG